MSLWKKVEISKDFEQTRQCDQRNCRHNDEGVCMVSKWDELFKEAREIAKEEKEEYVPLEECEFDEIDENYCEHCGEELDEGSDSEEFWGASVQRGYRYCRKCG